MATGPRRRVRRWGGSGGVPMRSLAHPDEHAALVLEPNHFSAAGLRHGLGTELPVASLLGSVPLDGTRHRPCDSRLRSASELNGIRVLDARVSGQASQPSTSLPMGGDAIAHPPKALAQSSSPGTSSSPSMNTVKNSAKGLVGVRAPWNFPGVCALGRYYTSARRRRAPPRKWARPSTRPGACLPSSWSWV